MIMRWNITVLNLLCARSWGEMRIRPCLRHYHLVGTADRNQGVMEALKGYHYTEGDLPHQERRKQREEVTWG